MKKSEAIICQHPEFKLWHAGKIGNYIWKETCTKCGFTQSPFERTFDWTKMPEHPFNRQVEHDAKILDARIKQSQGNI